MINAFLQIIYISKKHNSYKKEDKLSFLNLSEHWCKFYKSSNNLLVRAVTRQDKYLDFLCASCVGIILFFSSTTQFILIPTMVRWKFRVHTQCCLYKTFTILELLWWIDICICLFPNNDAQGRIDTANPIHCCFILHQSFKMSNTKTK